MGKALDQMTIEELWQLFPILLTEHKAEWTKWYQEEKLLLERGIGRANIHRIEHIGSTAISDIWAKPIVDILLETPSNVDVHRLQALAQRQGYICMSQCENRASLNKGYTPDGFAQRVFYLHLRVRGDNDELYFRDYLNAHADAAREYQQLKLSLWKMYEHDRDAYTRSKTEFIKRYTEMAKNLYTDRYA